MSKEQLLTKEYKGKFEEVMNLLADQNDPCCDTSFDEIIFAEAIIEALERRIKGLRMPSHKELKNE